MLVHLYVKAGLYAYCFINTNKLLCACMLPPFSKICYKHNLKLLQEGIFSFIFGIYLLFFFCFFLFFFFFWEGGGSNAYKWHLTAHITNSITLVYVNF